MNRATQHSTARGRAASRRAALVLCGLALALGLSPAVSGARSGRSFVRPQSPGVTGSQRYFVLHARPGQILTRRIEVVNVGHRTGSVLLYAVDATTGQTTGAVYQGADVARRGVGAWTSLGRRELRLAAGRSELVSVRVRVPRSAAPGTHLGGIVAESKTLLYPVPVLHRALRPGSYTAEVAVDNGHGQLVRARTPFEISSKQVKQVFGASSPLAQSGGGSSVGKYIPWALVVALAGVAGVLYRRQRRASARAGARDTAG